MHEDERYLLVEGWLEVVPETGQQVEPEPERQEVPWWFLGLAALILWGPLVGALARPYRRPE